MHCFIITLEHREFNFCAILGLACNLQVSVYSIRFFNV